MKQSKLIQLLTLLFLSLTCYAEEIEIKSFESTMQPMTVPMQRKDMNGEICALVKVALPTAKAVFEGSIVGDCEYKTCEYWCYLTPGSKFLRVKYPGFEPLMVSFQDYLGGGLESKRIYELILSVGTGTSVTETNTDRTSSPVRTTIGAINGHEYVDLGLPSGLKWATCNVGAKSPSDYGDYLAWGETKTKKKFTIKNSLTDNKSFGDISGNAEFDAAKANWGGSWRMPKKPEFEELLNNCTWTWVIKGNHKGYEVTGPNGNSIFLPAPGFSYEGHYHDRDSYGYYWSSDPDKNGSNTWELLFDSKSKGMMEAARYWGRSIRAVSE